ncbi:MAG: hypothetical protein KIH67_002375 [Candidatus Moranbacteria bacterium]|nr:hypothetical protein [Candidatus Moranbacteria bacterium]
MLYPIAVAITLWNLIVLAVGSLITDPATALIIGNVWLFLSTILGISLGKAISRRKLLQETRYRIYPYSGKPYLLPAL